MMMIKLFKILFLDNKKKTKMSSLNNLRQLMKSKKYFNDIIHAYIVPTTDPHRVRFILYYYFSSVIYLNRMNMLLIDINEENLFQILLDPMVRVLHFFTLLRKMKLCE
jgi:hypothetical protein